MSLDRATFVLRIKTRGANPRALWRAARHCEQLLREQAPGGTDVYPVELAHMPTARRALLERVGQAGRVADLHPLPARTRNAPDTSPTARPALGSVGYAHFAETAFASGHITAPELLEQTFIHAFVLARRHEKRARRRVKTGTRWYGLRIPTEGGFDD
jgi:hypothetical protein